MLVCGTKILGLTREQIWPVVILYWFINITYAPSGWMAGRLSDRIGRKPLMVASLVILGCLTLGFVLVGETFLGVGVLFALHGIYQGLMKPIQKAFVADLAPDHHRAEALGRFGMWAGLAAIPAPLFFGVLWDSAGWRVPFVISGVVVLACSVALGVLVPGGSGREPEAA
jgi:MFS family permease